MMPEEQARAIIDQKLYQPGWVIQDRKRLNLAASVGAAVLVFPASTGRRTMPYSLKALPLAWSRQGKAKREHTAPMRKPNPPGMQTAPSKLKFSYNAPVVLTFVLLCFLATLVGVLTGGKARALVFSVYRSSLASPLTYVRLLGHVFGHVSFEHFMSNAMLLLLLGPMLEEKYGSVTVLKVFVCTALVSGIVHWAFGGGSALCGASGIVFACITLSSFTAFRNNEIPISAVLVFLLFLGKEAVNGIFVKDDVSNLTHILGGLVGGGFGYLCNKQ